MNVSRTYNLLNDKDVEPMAPLVELWANQGVLPKRVVEDLNANLYKKNTEEGGAGGAAPAATNTTA